MLVPKKWQEKTKQAVVHMDPNTNVYEGMIS
jgi:hypothetical protein